MQSLGGRLELAQMQGCPQFFGDHRHLCSCVHLERHFVTINADGTVPHGGLVCTDGVEIGSVVVVCCIRLPGYVSNRLVEALCAIVPLLVAGVAFSVTHGLGTVDVNGVHGHSKSTCLGLAVAALQLLGGGVLCARGVL